jgi:hypothetical protein
LPSHRPEAKFKPVLACNQRNLGIRARDQSLRGGVLMAGVALGSFLLVAHFKLPRQVGWFVALPIALSSYMLISGIFGICVYNGLKGDRAADHGREAVLDPSNRAQMRNRAFLVVSASVLIACVFAAAFVAHV